VDGSQALEMLWAQKDIALVILDIMMPRMDGWEALKIIRERSDIPIIMLTALDDEWHEVHGLREGADDYISKPFSYELFVARVNTALKESLRRQAEMIDICGIRIDQRLRSVSAGGREIQLNRKEYDVLLYLLQHTNMLLTRDKLIDEVWGLDFEGDVRTVDTHIKTLRAKLGAGGTYIRTVRGSGYVMDVRKP